MAYSGRITHTELAKAGYTTDEHMDKLGVSSTNPYSAPEDNLRTDRPSVMEIDELREEMSYE
jgi:hypothetical protein